MHDFSNMRRLLSGVLLALCACGAAAQAADSELSARYPAGSIATIEAASEAHEQALSEHARIEQEYARDEQACRKVFFVTACRDKAKERRRAALESVRRVQAEADTLIRRIRVEERDRALADKQAERAVEALRIEQDAQKKAHEVAQKQARIAEREHAREQKEQLPAQPAVRTPHSRPEGAAEAGRRAANVAAYEKKILQAQERQRDLAARKAEKERNRKPPPAALPATPSP